MKKSILLIILSIVTLAAFCQTGKLEIILCFSEYYDFKVDDKYILYSGDSLVSEDFLGEESMIEIDSLKPGVYNIELYINDTLFLRRYNIVCKQDSVSQYTIDVENPYFKSKYDTISDLEIYSGLFYGPNIINESPYIMGSFSYNLGVNINLAKYCKHFSSWLIYGFEYAYTAFNNDTTMYPPAPVKYERYSNLNLNLGFFNRFSFFKSDENSITESLVLDLGLSYNFPIVFRHMYNIDNRKFVTMGLHQFSNFSVFSRFSYGSVAITGEYRIFDYVKGDFPEVPMLRLGVSFLIK